MKYLKTAIIPTFYKRDKQGIPSKWISYIKNTIAEIAPQFTTKRMIDDYFAKYYSKLFERSKMLKENDYEMAKKISLWKKKMIRGWESIEVVSVNLPDSSKRQFKLGEKFVAEITLELNEIPSTDIGIEVIFGHKEMDEVKEIFYQKEMEMMKVEDRKVTYQDTDFYYPYWCIRLCFQDVSKESVAAAQAGFQPYQVDLIIIDNFARKYLNITYEIT